MQIVQSTFLSCFRGRSSWSRLVSRSLRFRSCCAFPACRCPCCACRADSQVPLWRRLSCSHGCSSLRKSSPAENCNSPAVAVLHGRSLPCRDAEADPHGLVDRGDSAVAGGHGDRRPCCAGGASSAGAVVEKSVVLPRLHLVRNSLRAAHELPGRLFRALYTGTGPGTVFTGTRLP